MWQIRYEKVFKGISRESVWSVWEDVNSWPQWDTETESTKISGPFTADTTFVLRPKGGPEVTIRLTEVRPLEAFTDVTSFPLAKMYDTHAMEETPEGLKIISIIRVEGPLGWVWRKLVAEGVASGAPKQIDALVAYAKAKSR